MVKFIKFLPLCANKIWIYSIIISSLFISTVSAQHNNNNNRNIDDFRFATWNTAGSRWNEVYQLMIDNNIEVLAIQEAGSLPTQGTINEILDDYIRVCNMGETRRTDDVLFMRSQEYRWQINGTDFYIYYYDRVGHYLMHGHPERRNVNTAIITRQRADNIFILPPIYQNERRAYINRPVIGVRLENSVFLNVHGEPIRLRNETPQDIRIIQNYMARNHPSLTWALLGDFNRTPAELDSDINRMPPPDHTFRQTVSSGEATHIDRNHPERSAELDYAVVGGPTNSRFDNIIALLILMSVSDHKPVRFN
ncbi:MAG: cytolethal distending toxin S-CDT [Candidatus Hamiltonella defensa (Ceratovacuna japonica)]